MAAAPMAQKQRTASVRAAAPAATAKVRPSAVQASRALSRAEMADIMAMLAASAHHRAAGFANKISFGVKEVGIRGVWRRDLTAERGCGTFETNVLDKRNGCRQGAERCISAMVRRSFSICGAETSG